MPEAWVLFHKQERPEWRRTDTWIVIPGRKRDPDGTTCRNLGVVRWYAPWRRFAFFPDDWTIYDAGYLKTIARFCERETEKRKRA